MQRYTPLKIFHYTDKLDALPRETGRVEAPVHVRLKPTNQCNHACAYCAYRSKALQLGRDMRLADSLPRPKMREIVDDLVDMGVGAVTFSGGGEPFVYPHLAEAADRLAAGGVRIASLTNGGRLAGEAADVFARRGTWLRVSMDGFDGPSYARYRGVAEDEFDRVLGNIRRFAAQGGPCRLGVSYVVDRGNAHKVRDMAARLKDLGVDSFKVSPCVVADDAAANNAYHEPLFALVRPAVDAILETLADDGFEVFDAYHAFSGRFAKSYSWCPSIQLLAVIGADQRVYACQDKAYNRRCGLLGSIRQRRFKEFWLDGKDKFFAIDPSRDCPHHCVAQAKNELVLGYLGADPQHLPFV